MWHRKRGMRRGIWFTSSQSHEQPTNQRATHNRLQMKIKRKARYMYTCTHTHTVWHPQTVKFSKECVAQNAWFVWVSNAATLRTTSSWVPLPGCTIKTNLVDFIAECLNYNYLYQWAKRKAEKQHSAALATHSIFQEKMIAFRLRIYLHARSVSQYLYRFK